MQALLRRRRDRRLRPIARALGAGPYAPTRGVPLDVDLRAAVVDHAKLRAERLRREGREALAGVRDGR